MAWLAASDSGRFTAPHLFYLSRLSLIISFQDTDNRGKEACWLGQVLGGPKGFKGLQITRLGQSHQVPLGSRRGVLSQLKQQGFSEFTWCSSYIMPISLGPIMAETDLSMCVDLSPLLILLSQEAPEVTEHLSIQGGRGAKRPFR